ncbi:MAG: cobalamin biosynthesis protein [Candidatus Wukongarchaeota archaeon]|nr:cobalamin biosynthesis protein [Candidatus Wukongarchaeota archaeon]MDO8129586.1 cobalamin biosynthesis protein [Candidatus Wukongarchaeota archaeon]
MDVLFFTEWNGIAHLLFVEMAIIGLAVFLDLLFGEPPLKVHPVVWMGALIDKLGKFFSTSVPEKQRMRGVFLALTCIFFVAVPVFFLSILMWRYLDIWSYIVVSAFLLKATFAVRCLREHVYTVRDCLYEGDIEGARGILPGLVGRDPSKLGEREIISATIESTAESTVDSFTSPIFYYVLFGLLGAYVYRMINTLDSMVGHKTEEYVRYGWFSAKIDELVNYLPSRITSIFIVLSAFLSGYDWRKSWGILRRDRYSLESRVGGWSMAPMAGALGVQLEKPEFYTLGDPKEEMAVEHITRAWRVTFVTIILFFVMVVPIILLLMDLFDLYFYTHLFSPLSDEPLWLF